MCHIHRNGLVGSNSDHGPFDGIVTAMHAIYANTELAKMGNAWTHGDSGRTPSYEQLKFIIDKKIEDGISKAYLLWKAVEEDIDVLVVKFEHFAMNWFRAQKLPYSFE